MHHFTSRTGEHSLCRISLVLLAFCWLLAGIITPAAYSQEAAQKAFASPEDALEDLVRAAAKNDTTELLAVFGPEGRDLVLTGNETEDKENRERFVSASRELKRITFEGDNKAILHFGKEDWPLPIPLIRKGDVWIFDTMAGKEEIINRRIGRNELSAIEVCKEYVSAQREYASKERDGSGVLKYAQKIASSPGKHDGLYWAYEEGGEQSPLGPLVAKAEVERGPAARGGVAPVPYHGYFYRILKGQERHAPGGAYRYVINGNMVAGFALVAYPALYGTTGITTFLVNQNGVVYQRDLGNKTGEKATTMKRFNPGRNWKKVE
jgi:hypothetical protein